MFERYTEQTVRALFFARYDDAYWFHREEAPPEGPFCATCWDSERRWVRQLRDVRGVARCEHCGRPGRDS